MILTLVGLLFLGSLSSEPEYPYVFLDNQLELHVFSESRYKSVSKYRIRINNESGNEWAIVGAYYDGFSKVKEMSAVVYDAGGKRIKKSNLKQAYDKSEIDESMLFSDQRSKWLDLRQNVFPYELEVEIVKEVDGYLYLPSFIFTSHGKGFVNKKQLRIIAADTTLYSVFHFQTSVRPVISQRREFIVKEWTVENIGPEEDLGWAPPWQERLGWIQPVPNRFSMQKVPGRLASWNDLALWFRTLNLGQDELPAEEVERVKALTKNATSTHEKIDILFADLRSSTRYLAVNLGIGGFQSIPASTVCKTKFGDCKGLSTYMKGMLGAVGIHSNYAFIERTTGESDIKVETPFHQFNHVILAVPTEKDTVWLECTSSVHPAGYLDRGISDRHALFVTETGGHLVKTPVYTSKENRQLRHATVTIESKGAVNAKISERRTGHLQDRFRYSSTQVDPKYLENTVREELPNGSLTLKNISSKVDNQHPIVDVSYDLSSVAMVSRAGKMLLFKASLFDQQMPPSPLEKDRTLPLFLRNQYSATDSISIQIPAGYKVTSLPPDQEIMGPGTRFERKITVQGTEVLVLRKMERTVTKLSAEKGTEFVSYLAKVAAADQVQIVLAPETK